MVFFFKKRGGDGKKPATAMGGTEPSITIVPPVQEAAPAVPNPTAAALAFLNVAADGASLAAWTATRGELRAADQGFVFFENAENGVHSFSRLIPGVGPGDTVRLAIVMRSGQRKSAALWIYGDGPDERSQCEAIVNFASANIDRVRTNNTSCKVVEANAVTLPGGWTGYELVAKFSDPAVRSATVMVAARPETAGSSAYQGENLGAIKVFKAEARIIANA